MGCWEFYPTMLNVQMLNMQLEGGLEFYLTMLHPPYASAQRVAREGIIQQISIKP